MGAHHSSSASAGNHSPDAILAAIEARNGQSVFLASCASGGNIEAKPDGTVDARGGNARNANWTLVTAGGDTVTFRDSATGGFLKHNNNGLTADGNSNDGNCKFKLVHIPSGNISLLAGSGVVGFSPDGTALPPNKVNRNTAEGQLNFEFAQATTQSGFGGGFQSQGGYQQQGGNPYQAQQQGGYQGGQGGYQGGYQQQGGNPYQAQQQGGYQGGQGGYQGGYQQQGGNPYQAQQQGGYQGGQGGYQGGQGGYQGQDNYVDQERREERKEELREERIEERREEERREGHHHHHKEEY